MPVSNNAQTSFELLVLAPNSWQSQWVNRQQLFSRIGQSHSVLYSTGGWFTWDRYLPDWKQASWTGQFPSYDNVWVDKSPRWLLRIPRFPVLDRFAITLQVGRWRRFLSTRGKGPLIAYIFHPKFFPYVKALGADYVVYHAYDMYDHMPGWTAKLDCDERELARTANLVITASEQMAEGLRAKVKREVRVLPNGANVAAFDHAIATTQTIPKDLSKIPRPWLGWVGSLHPQIDYLLISELARRHPSWSFVFVGGVIVHADARADEDRADCFALPNVHSLGGKLVDEVPLYVTKMDVNLMCYRLSEQTWIKAGYPLKLHEYLAAGRPIVSADLAAVRPFSTVVRMAEGVDDWQAAIEEALTTGGRGTPEQRRAVAAENSWDSRVNVLNAWLSNLVKSGNGTT